MSQVPSIPFLDEVFVEASFLMGVAASPGVLEVSFNFALTKHHENVRKPRPRPQDAFDYRPGYIRFRGVSGFEWRFSEQAIGAYDGEVQSFLQDHHTFHLVGEFGEIRIDAHAVEAGLYYGQTPADGFRSRHR